MNAYTFDAPASVRCSATMGALTCSLAYDHAHGHVYVTGSYVGESHHEDDGGS